MMPVAHGTLRMGRWRRTAHDSSYKSSQCSDIRKPEKYRSKPWQLSRQSVNAFCFGWVSSKTSSHPNALLEDARSPSPHCPFRSRARG